MYRLYLSVWIYTGSWCYSAAKGPRAQLLEHTKNENMISNPLCSLVLPT